MKRIWRGLIKIIKFVLSEDFNDQCQIFRLEKELKNEK
jgi:hypothetical protein